MSASREFGDDLEMRTLPGGSTYMLVPETAHDRYIQREAERVEEELRQLRTGSSEAQA
jgi:hypothetical protein